MKSITSILSKQTTLLLITLVSLSTLFLPLTTLRASTLANGMDATNVLGASDFTSIGFGLNNVDSFLAFDTVYDPVNDRLFTAQTLLGMMGIGSRVVVYEIGSGITNGMGASYVLGTDSFAVAPVATTTASSFDQSGLALAHNSENDILFVSDAYNRILVFDLSGGITNGMDASYVLGQADFTSSNSTTSQNGFDNQRGVDYDEVNNRLFVADSNNNRVMVFDMSGGITNGMNASWVIGQENFTSNVGTTSINGFQNPQMLDYDEINERLFVSDSVNKRVLVFDLSGGITNGMDASYVLGQADFTSSVSSVSQNGFATPVGISIDEANERLFVSENQPGRVLVFDLSGGITNGMDASYVLGQPDFISNATGLTAGTFNSHWGTEYVSEINSLVTSDLNNARFLIFNLTPTPSSSGGSLKYTTPPQCSASFWFPAFSPAEP
jgi:hypothetical protein